MLNVISFKSIFNMQDHWETHSILPPRSSCESESWLLTSVISSPMSPALSSFLPFPTHPFWPSPSSTGVSFNLSQTNSWNPNTCLRLCLRGNPSQIYNICSYVPCRALLYQNDIVYPYLIPLLDDCFSYHNFKSLIYLLYKSSVHMKTKH
jgi:hypothetical protein